MGLFGDETTGIVKVRLEPESWPRIANSHDPPGEVARRGLAVLETRFDMKPEDVSAIAADPVYRQSCADEYESARRNFARSRRPPSAVVLRYTRPTVKAKEEAGPGANAPPSR
jgi:hypothetical protein